MPLVKYVGKASLKFYGKFLSEISKNLKNRGKGRVVIRESECKQYTEPCFYVLDDVQPLMSDETHARCRAWGERIFRGHNLGRVLLPQTYEPDWRLLSLSESEALIELASQPEAACATVPVKCIAPMPPLLSIYLRRSGKIPIEMNEKAKSASTSCTNEYMVEASGLLLLLKHLDDPTSMIVPIEPTEEEKQRIYPPYQWSARSGLLTKRNIKSDTYMIRRSDTPGLYWRVHLAPNDTKNTDVQNTSSPSHLSATTT